MITTFSFFRLQQQVHGSVTSKLLISNFTVFPDEILFTLALICYLFIFYF